MPQAKHRKVLWLLLLIWMLVLHSWLSEKLMAASFRAVYFSPAVLDCLRILLPCVWLAGALCMALWQFGSYQRFRRKALESMKPVEESWMRSACEQAAREAGCEAVPPLYQSGSVSTPLVLGFAAPVMLVPEGEYTWAELRMVFLHECAHIRKKDLWYKLIFTAAACILWFQPLLYLLKAAAYRDLEIACDQSVVEGKPEADRKAYADFLLESLRKGRNRVLPYSAYFYNSKSVMKARLAVVEDTRVRSGIPGAAVCAALTVLTALILADRVDEIRQAFRNPDAAELPQNLYEDSEPPESLAETEAGSPELDLWELPECRARTRDRAAEVTWNDGADWQEGAHSLTIGAEFVTPEVGFVAIRSSQEPELYRTEDGGVNWELCAFPESGAENEEFYTMAYPPEQKEDRLCVYLGMEEYSELGGTRLRYESEDLGKTWSYTGEVRRQ